MSNVHPLPKYQRVADAIEGEIRGGKWDGGKMPSVREVASAHRVSIVTASRAIQVIRDKGLIRTVERAGTFRMPAPTADTFALMIRVTHGVLAGEVFSAVRHGFERFARRSPMHLVSDAFQLAAGMTPADATAAAGAAVASGIDGVFLLPSRASAAEAALEATFLDGCRAAGLPVVLIERNLRGRDELEHDLVALDDVGVTAACTRHLIALGRKRIGIAVASPTSSHRHRVAGYLLGLQAARKRAGDLPPVVLHTPEEHPTPRVGEFLADEVVAKQLDAIVCYHDYIALSVMVELLRRGRRVPADVAIIGFENLQAASVAALGLTTCEYPGEAMAEHAVRLLHERRAAPDRPPVTVVVPTRLIVRGSTDPTAGR